MKVIRLSSLKALPFIIFAAILGWSCDKVTIPEDMEEHIIVSNVFSPNSTINKNYFEVKSSDDQPVSLEIFTRAGVLVFSIEAELCIWDGCSLSGQPMAAGIYFYAAEVRDSSPKISKCGYVHLYR